MADYTGMFFCEKHHEIFEKKYPMTQSVEARLFYGEPLCNHCNAPAKVWARGLSNART